MTTAHVGHAPHDDSLQGSGMHRGFASSTESRSGATAEKPELRIASEVPHRTEGALPSATPIRACCGILGPWLRKVDTMTRMMMMWYNGVGKASWMPATASIATAIQLSRTWKNAGS